MVVLLCTELIKGKLNAFDVQKELKMQEYTEETNAAIYRITSDGRVFTQSKHKIPLVGAGMEFTGEFKVILKPEREMTYTVNNRGYKTVGINKTTYMVHRLVAKAFVSNPDNKPFVNHLDGNKLNNCKENLEWCTTKENNHHARITGLNVQAKGYKAKYQSDETKKKSLANLKDKSKLTPEEVRYVRKVFVPRSKEFSATALAKQFGTSVAAMCKIVTGQTYQDIK